MMQVKLSMVLKTLVFYAGYYNDTSSAEIVPPSALAKVPSYCLSSVLIFMWKRH